MSHTLQRRGAQALGAAAIFVLAFSGPANARPDEAVGSQQGSSQSGQASQRQNECHYLNQCSGSGEGSTGSTPRSQVVRVDDNAVEVLQLGAGLLAGFALAGAGAAAFSRRSHGQMAHPA
jgi:hypothetical protein